MHYEKRVIDSTISIIIPWRRHWKFGHPFLTEYRCNKLSTRYFDLMYSLVEHIAVDKVDAPMISFNSHEFKIKEYLGLRKLTMIQTFWQNEYGV